MKRLFFICININGFLIFFLLLNCFLQKEKLLSVFLLFLLFLTHLRYPSFTIPFFLIVCDNPFNFFFLKDSFKFTDKIEKSFEINDGYQILLQFLIQTEKDSPDIIVWPFLSIVFIFKFHSFCNQKRVKEFS